MKLKRHPLSALFSQFDLAGADLDNLAADIVENGQQEPIKLYNGMVLDGWNRYQACQLGKVEPMTIDLEVDDPWKYVVSINIQRRHMTPGDIAAVYLKKQETEQGGPNGPLQTPSKRQIAKETGVSTTTAQRIAKVAKDAAPEVRKAVVAGEVSISDAAKIAALPKEEQPQALVEDRRKTNTDKPAVQTLSAEQQLMDDAFGDLDPIEELERVTKQLQDALQTVDSLQADDKTKEIGRLNAVNYGLHEQLNKSMVRAETLSKELATMSRIVTELVKITGVDHPKKLILAVKLMKKESV